MTASDPAQLPDALLLIGPGCPHCPTVMRALTDLLKQNRLGSLEIVNITAHPERAAAVGTRSVPWTRIGPFELAGAQSPVELADWVDHASQGTGMAAYLSHLLESQRLAETIQRARENPNLLADLVSLIGDLTTPMAVRIGAGAVFEDLASDGLLLPIIPELGALTRSDEVQVRADACHYLGLTGSSDARPYIEALLDDEDGEVREIAAESLPLLHPA